MAHEKINLGEIAYNAVKRRDVQGRPFLPGVTGEYAECSPDEKEEWEELAWRVCSAVAEMQLADQEEKNETWSERETALLAKLDATEDLVRRVTGKLAEMLEQRDAAVFGKKALIKAVKAALKS